MRNDDIIIVAALEHLDGLFDVELDFLFKVTEPTLTATVNNVHRIRQKSNSFYNKV